MQVTRDAALLRELGEIIRRIRVRRGMSIRAAAERVKMSEVTWGKIENGGSAMPATLRRIAVALDLNGQLVIEAASDPARLTELASVLTGRLPTQDLSDVPDIELIAELERRLTTRCSMIRATLAEQGQGHRSA